MTVLKLNQDMFPISRDPPEGGTCRVLSMYTPMPERFPISRDPPEGGTRIGNPTLGSIPLCFQFLGIPPKGEHNRRTAQDLALRPRFPISRDPPEGGTRYITKWSQP